MNKINRTGVRIARIQGEIRFPVKVPTIFLTGGNTRQNPEIIISAGSQCCAHMLSIEKIRKMGNTALIGAKMFLFNDYHKIEEILKITRHINLEADEAFQELFIQHMLFKPG